MKFDRYTINYYYSYKWVKRRKKVETIVSDCMKKYILKNRTEQKINQIKNPLTRSEIDMKS